MTPRQHAESMVEVAEGRIADTQHAVDTAKQNLAIAKENLATRRAERDQWTACLRSLKRSGVQ